MADEEQQLTEEAYETADADYASGEEDGAYAVAVEEDPEEPIEDRVARVVSGLTRLASSALACRILKADDAITDGLDFAFLADPLGYLADEIAAGIRAATSQPADETADEEMSSEDGAAYEEDGSEEDGTADDAEAGESGWVDATGEDGASEEAEEAAEYAADEEVASVFDLLEEVAEADPEVTAPQITVARTVALLRLYRTVRGGGLDEGELRAAVLERFPQPEPEETDYAVYDEVAEEDGTDAEADEE